MLFSSYHDSSFLWGYSPTRVQAASLLRFLDHTHRHKHTHITGKTLLNEREARRRGL